MRKFFFVVVSLIFCGISFAGTDLTGRLIETSQADSNYDSLLQDLITDSSVDSSQLEALASNGNWQTRLQAQVVLGWRSYPDLYEKALVYEMVPTRSGFMKYPGRDIEDPRLAPLHLDRLIHSAESEVEKTALIELIPRSGGDWSEAMVALIPLETNDDVRAMMIGSLKRADPVFALEGLKYGLNDSNAYVRSEAARIAGYHPDGTKLAPELIKAINSDNESVRAMAIKSLGYLQVSDAFDQIGSRLKDEDPQVRLMAIRALERIDKSKLLSMSVLQDLAKDTDPKVSRAASLLLEK